MPSPDPRSEPEIQEAIALFEKWERSIADPAAAGHFAQAVELLDDYLAAEPGSAHEAFVQNVKVANTRRLLQLLKRVDRKDVSAWMEYVAVLVVFLRGEADALMARHPELKADFDAFVAVWGREYVEALRRAAPSA